MSCSIKERAKDSDLFFFEIVEVLYFIAEFMLQNKKLWIW